MTSRTSRKLIGAFALGMFLASSTPAMTQDSSGEARIRKLEGEVRALQRKVFPGGDGRFFEPQISADNRRAASTAAPSTSAVTDILARLDALETQIAALTARSELNGNTLSRLESRVAVLEGGNATLASSSTRTPEAVNPPVTSTSTSTAAAASGPSASRLAGVSQIAKPKTDDAGDDEYSYGFRLWNAGYYPEAQQQLTLFVEKYPSHWRTTYGRNLLGRAYLDDNKPREAASWFLKNYQSDKTGARAADSLLYLAEAMIALNDTNRACIALAEFADTYPAVASGRLSNQYQAGLGKVSCN